MIYGALIVLVAVFQPRGLMGLVGRLGRRPDRSPPPGPVVASPSAG